MAIKIKVKGGSSSKAKASSAPAKKSSGSTKRGTATKGRSAAKGRASTPRKAAAPRQSQPSAGAQAKQKAIKQYETKLTKAGENLVKTREAHEDAVNSVHEITQEALAAGVPMTVVSNLTGVSRQWLYKMGEHGGRNGQPKTRGRKPAAKKTATKKTTAAKKGGRTRIKRK